MTNTASGWNSNGVRAALLANGHSLTLGRSAAGKLAFMHYDDTLGLVNSTDQLDGDIYDSDNYDLSADNSGNAIALWRDGANVFIRHYKTATGWVDVAQSLSTTAKNNTTLKTVLAANEQLSLAWVDNTSNGDVVRVHHAVAGTAQDSCLLYTSPSPRDS